MLLIEGRWIGLRAATVRCANWQRLSEVDCNGFVDNVSVVCPLRVGVRQLRFQGAEQSRGHPARRGTGQGAGAPRQAREPRMEPGGGARPTGLRALQLPDRAALQLPGPACLRLPLESLSWPPPPAPS